MLYFKCDKSLVGIRELESGEGRVRELFYISWSKKGTFE